MDRIPQFYFDPSSDNRTDPFIKRADQAEAVAQFLRAAEELVPDMISDLRGVAPMFTPTVSRTLWSGVTKTWWSILTGSEDPECIAFRSAMCEWATKYHLDGQELYMNIATVAIYVYVLHLLAMHDLPVEFFSTGVIPPDGVRGFTEGRVRLLLQRALTQSNAPLSLVDGISLSPSKSRLHFEREFPFVFAPTINDVRVAAPGLTPDRLVPDAEEALYEMLNPNAPMFGRTRPYTFDPQRTDWNNFEIVIDHLYKQYKAWYKLKVENYLRQNGFEHTTEKRKTEHFEWLVRWQIQGWKQREIADYYSKEGYIKSEDTIGKGLHSAAELVLLHI